MLILTIVIIILIYLCYNWIQNASEAKQGKPPGPWAFPVFGNLPQLGLKPQVTLSKWKKTYGPIISIQFGSIPAVVLNDAKLIKEAFGMDAFSGRPYIKMFHEVTNGKRGLVMNDGPGWLEQRRFVAKGLNECGIRTIESKTQEEVNQLLDNLSCLVGQSIEMKHRFSAHVLNALWSIIMGQRFKPDDPELQRMVKNIEKGTSNFGILTGLAITIPWIGNLCPDFCGISSIINSLIQVREAISSHIETHKKSRVPDQPRDFADMYLDKIDSTQDPQSSFQDNQQPLTTSELFAAGFETTSATLEWLVIYMVLYPEVQIRLQQEIDLIVGPTRRPNLDDRPQMIFTEAVICETMRYASSGPFGLFHNTMDNVTFKGHNIPKDTLIMANFHCINHDPELWGDPQNFRPARFLDEENFFQFEHFLPFSCGKRKCVGKDLAKDTLFLFCAGLFQKFSISSGAVLPSLDAKMGFLISPQPFQVILNKR